LCGLSDLRTSGFHKKVFSSRSIVGKTEKNNKLDLLITLLCVNMECIGIVTKSNTSGTHTFIETEDSG
jgi:hypothetical protein